MRTYASLFQVLQAWRTYQELLDARPGGIDYETLSWSSRTGPGRVEPEHLDLDIISAKVRLERPILRALRAFPRHVSREWVRVRIRGDLSGSSRGLSRVDALVSLELQISGVLSWKA